MSEASKKANERLSSILNTIGGYFWESENTFPAFDDLPKVPGQPQGCMWGVYDKDGKSDEIGSVNLLTPDVVKAASSEIIKGESIQLDWPIENVEFPGFGRKKFEQKIIKQSGFAAMDDELHFNTQSGSQWDSLKHFGHQASQMYYNGVSHDDIDKSPRNGTHNWCRRGGIVGRGVLIDWVRWYEHKHGTPPSPITRYAISKDEILETLKYQGTELHFGDIAVFRSGYVRWHNAASPPERKSGTQENGRAIGLRNDEEMVRWLYENHFAAVAGDTVAFEAWPPPIRKGWCLHEWLLVQWGTPIGEMWDLEALSKKCEAEGRWTFFLTSAPLHVTGGIGSPPGAIAIF